MKAFIGFLILLTSQAFANGTALNTKTFAVPGTTFITTEVDGEFPDLTSQWTDVLFVVDDSGSMTAHQENLARHIDAFTAEALNTGNQFHVGVTSTSADRGKSGHLLGLPTIIDPQTPDLAETMATHLKLGTLGSGTETLFEPVIEGLSEPLISTVNNGFLREGAALAIVFLTDAEDQSRITPGEFENFLIDLKGSKDRVIVEGIIVSSEDLANKTCRGDGKPPVKIETVLDAFGTKPYSLCSTDMRKDISEIAKKIFPEFDEIDYKPGVLLDEVELFDNPVAKSIQVKFGNQILEEDVNGGWVYNNAKNVVQFSQNIQWEPQAPDTKIQIIYQLQ